MRYSLRPYQQDLVAAVQRLQQDHRRILVNLPTGGGKTVVGTHFIEECHRRGGRSLFLAHRAELIEQTSAKLDEIGLTDHGVIKAGHWRWRPGAPVQVASVQTLNARLDKLRSLRFDLIFPDEAHHGAADTWLRAINTFRNDATTVIGLTATPYRADGKGLGDVFDTIAQGADTRALTDQQFLTPTIVFADTQTPDLSRIRLNRYRDYDAKGMHEAFDNKRLVGHLVQTWTRHAKGRRTVVFAVSVEHSKHIAEMYNAVGIPAAHVDGTMPDQQRAEISERLRTGDLLVVSNCMVWTEGWDCPEVQCLQNTRPTKSRGLWRQIGGRGLRPVWDQDTGQWRRNPDDTFVKPHCLYLDHAGQTHEHGFLTDPDIVDLRRGLLRDESARATVCDHCGAVLRSKPFTCPACGAELRPRPEVTEEQLDLIGETELPDIRPGELKAVDENEYKSHVLRQLQERARDNGYSAEWVLRTFRDTFGHPPTHRQGRTFTEHEKTSILRDLVQQAQQHRYNPRWIGIRFNAIVGHFPPKSLYERESGIVDRGS